MLASVEDKKDCFKIYSFVRCRQSAWGEVGSRLEAEVGGVGRGGPLVSREDSEHGGTELAEPCMPPRG